MKNKHREIKTIKLWTDGSIVIIFKDESHTYIEKKIVKEIYEELNKINLNEI